VEQTQPFLFSQNETADIGRDSGTCVSTDYGRRDCEFSGKINWVRLDLGLDSASHLIRAEDRLRVALLRQ
jgi:arylsulfatase